MERIGNVLKPRIRTRPILFVICYNGYPRYQASIGAPEDGIGPPVIAASTH